MEYQLEKNENDRIKRKGRRNLGLRLLRNETGVKTEEEQANNGEKVRMQ